MLGEEGVVEIESHWAATRRENQGVSDVWRGRLCAYITISTVKQVQCSVEHFVRTIDGGGWQMIVAAFSE